MYMYAIWRDRNCVHVCYMAGSQLCTCMLFGRIATVYMYATWRDRNCVHVCYMAGSQLCTCMLYGGIATVLAI